MGMPVADMTSGYRVYRYHVLRQISFESAGFAFLPEMLMRAHAAGHLIIEEPIQFIFRVAGESKMRLLPTALSYAKLFGARFSSLPALAAAFVLIVALAIRLLVAFPVHKYQADADGILAGLCGVRVLHGSHPVFFPGGYRLGAQSCYVTAGAFALFGVSRQSLAVTGLVFSSLFVFFIYLYLREAFGSRASVAGLLMAAVPPLQLLINTYVPWAYGEILMYCASSLWLGVTLERRRPRTGWFLAFGVSAGLAMWCSAQSLMIISPVILWLLLRRVLNSVTRICCTAAGILIGSSPIWIFLVRGGAQKVLGDGAMHTANNLAQVLANISYLIFTQIPWLLAERQAHGLTMLSEPGVTLLLYGTAVLVLTYLAIWRNSALRKREALVSQAALIGLIILCCAGLYVFSAAGSVRGWTTRYILPLYLVVPGIAAILFALLKRIWLVLAALALVFLLFMNARDYPFSTSPVRKSLRASLMADRELIHWLSQNHIQAVLGGYWDVYSLNFDSGGVVLGIPVENEFDYLAFARGLGSKQIRWALIDHRPTHLVEWEHHLQLQGDIFPMGSEHFLFVPDSNPPGWDAGAFLKLARATDPN